MIKRPERRQLGIIRGTCGVIRDTVGIVRPGAKSLTASQIGLALDPYIAVSARQSLLAAGGGQAGFEEWVPTLSNLATGSNAAGDITQTTSSQQGFALPVSDGGYLYLPGVSGDYVYTGETLSMSAAWVMTIEGILNKPASGDYSFVGEATGGSSFTFRWRHFGVLDFCFGGFTNGESAIRGVSDASLVSGTHNKIVVAWDGIDTATLWFNDILQGTYVLTSPEDFSELIIGARTPTTENMLGTITKFSITGATTLDIDFTDPAIAHGASSFTCATGQTVTINQSGNNPATIIRHPVLVADGVDDFYQFASTAIPAGSKIVSVLSLLNSSNSTPTLFRGIRYDQNSETWRTYSTTGSSNDNIAAVSVNGVVTASQPIGQRSLVAFTIRDAQSFDSLFWAVVDRYIACHLEEIWVFPPETTDAQIAEFTAQLNSELSIY